MATNDVDYATRIDLVGLGLPARKDPGGYFQTKDRFEVAWSDILFAILVPRGARVMKRQFGSSLFDLLFEPTGPDVSVAVYAIQETLRESCPHIQIERAQITSQEDGRVEIGVVFSLRTDLETKEERTVTVERRTVTSVG